MYPTCSYRVLATTPPPFSGIPSPEMRSKLAWLQHHYCIDVGPNLAVPTDLTDPTSVADSLISRYQRALKGKEITSDKSIPFTSNTNATSLNQRACLPVLVINLARRVDRWRSSVIECSRHNLACIQVSALDAQAPGVIVSDRIVATSWDTTLHSKHDTRYEPQSVSMSPSERCCAASHVAVWRAIDTVRQRLLDPASKAAHTSETPASAALTSPADNSYLLEQMASLFLQSHLYSPINCTVSAALSLSTVVTKENKLPTTPFQSPLSADLDWYLIAEDDFRVSPAALSTYTDAPEPSLVTVIRALINDHVPADYDLLYLSYQASPKAKLTEVNKYIIRPGYLWAAGAYVLRGRAVRTLLGCLPVSAPLDRFLAQLVQDKDLIVRTVYTYCIYI